MRRGQEKQDGRCVEQKRRFVRAAERQMRGLHSAKYTELAENIFNLLQKMCLKFRGGHPSSVHPARGRLL